MFIPLLFIFLIPYAYADSFDSAEKRIDGIPTVCTIAPNDPLISNTIKSQYMSAVRDAVLEWQHLLQASAKNPNNWNILYMENQNNCDVMIEFKRHYDDIAEPDYSDILGVYYDGKIELYFQEFSTCGEQGERRCYYDDVIPARELSVTAKHEFGHALGLGHFIAYPDYDNMGAKSIMNPATTRINDENKIRDVDIKNVYYIYGDGFGNITPAKLKAKQYSIGMSQDFSQEINHLILIEKLHGKKVDHIPSWLKHTIGWWANGSISDVEFYNGLQYLLNRGII